MKYEQFAIIHCKYEDYGGCEWLSIVKQQHDQTTFDVYVTYYIKSNSNPPVVLEYAGYQDADCEIQLASPDQVKLLFDAIEKDGRVWGDGFIIL